jgi:hypothetical protein
MPRIDLYFKNSKFQIRLNRIQEICPYLTENHTATVAKTKRFMLLIEVSRLYWESHEKQKCTACENAGVVHLVNYVFSKVNINLCSYNTIY